MPTFDLCQDHFRLGGGLGYGLRGRGASRELRDVLRKMTRMQLSDTGSRLTSPVNARRVFVVIRAPRSLKSLSEVSTQPREGQFEP